MGQLPAAGILYLALYYGLNGIACIVGALRFISRDGQRIQCVVVRSALVLSAIAALLSITFLILTLHDFSAVSWPVKILATIALTYGLSITQYFAIQIVGDRWDWPK